MKADGTDGRPVAPSESPEGYAVSGTPQHLNDKGRANTGEELDSMTGAQEVDGRPGAAPSSKAALGATGGMNDPKRISSMRGQGSATLPDVPITGDPANTPA